MSPVVTTGRAFVGAAPKLVRQDEEEGKWV